MTLTLSTIIVCIQGDNLDSVETSEIRVTVGGEECTKTPSNSRVSDIICTVPLEPPGGQNPAIINVSNFNYNWGKRSESLPSDERCNFVCVCVSWAGTIFVFCTRDPLPTFT